MCEHNAILPHDSNTPQHPQPQQGQNGPYDHATDVQLLNLIVKYLIDEGFIQDIRTTEKCVHDGKVSPEFDDLEAAIDEAHYRRFLEGRYGHRRARQDAADAGAGEGGGGE